MKKIISILVTLSIVLSFAWVCGEEADTASVITSDWAKESVQYGYELGIVKENLQFTKPISREKFCELIYNLVIKVNGMLAAPPADNFTDVTNERILMLAGAGIINGKSETEFCPHDSLTRAEAATIIVRMINKFMPMEATMMWYEFEDGDKIPLWASDSVQTICNLGFMKGVGDGEFAPDLAYTAEQAVATLVRVYDSAVELGLLGNSINAGVIGGFDGLVEMPEE